MQISANAKQIRPADSANLQNPQFRFVSKMKLHHLKEY